MKKRVITISREFGSGGRYIAKTLADKLGYKFYDRDIIGKVVEKTAYSESFVAKHGEYSQTKSLFSYSHSPMFSDGSTVEDYILEAQQDVILELAAGAPCVIVGRSANYILSGREDVLNVFIYGDKEAKVERVCRIYDKSEKQAIKLMNDMDKKRSINYEYWTGRKWGSIGEYDISLNSSRLGYEKCVDIITSSL